MKRNPVEWLVLGVSVLAIVIVVGALLVEGLDEGGPANPSITLHRERARQGAQGWIVPATVRNLGDEAAETVLVEATAEVAGATETSTLTIEFLPSGTAVQVAFAFSQPPTSDIAVRLVSFATP